MKYPISRPVPDGLWEIRPAEGVERGDLPTFTIECETEGAGTAYGCYVVAHLDPLLGEDILLLPERMLYDPKTRNLLRKIGPWPQGSECRSPTRSRSRTMRPALNLATDRF